MNKKLLYPLVGSLVAIAVVQFAIEDKGTLEEASASVVSVEKKQTPMLRAVNSHQKEEVKTNSVEQLQADLKAKPSVAKSPISAMRKVRVAPQPESAVLLQAKSNIADEISPVVTMSNRFDGIQVFVQNRDTKEFKRVVAIQDDDHLVPDELPMPVFKEEQVVASLDNDINIYTPTEVSTNELINNNVVEESVATTAEAQTNALNNEAEEEVFSSAFMEGLLEEEQTINDWSDLDLETVKWKEVMYSFVPEDFKEGTILLETYTEAQHQRDFQAQIKNYYEQNNINALNAVIKPGMPGFEATQAKKVKKIMKGSKADMVAVNESEVKNYDKNEYRYILRKVISVQNVDPATGSGEAHIQYYFYDRINDEQFPMMHCNYQWLSKHLK